MKCPSCGTENEPHAVFCTSCRQPLKGPAEQISADSREPRIGILAFGLFIAILVSVMLIFAWFSQPAEEDGNDGSLVITLINPTYIGALPCEYVLELNGQPERNGTVPVGESDVVEKNFSFSGSELVVVVHVEVIGSTTQPDDITVTITRGGEVERITITLRMTTS